MTREVTEARVLARGGTVFDGSSAFSSGISYSRTAFLAWAWTLL